MSVWAGGGGGCEAANLQLGVLARHPLLPLPPHPQGEDHRCLDHLAHYLKDEFKNKRGEEVRGRAQGLG